jgi:hypothetical protein
MTWYSKTPTKPSKPRERRLYSRPYVGCRKDGPWEVFRATSLPTQRAYPQFFAVIGPFRTRAGAEFMAKYGPHHPPLLQTVADAERFARKGQNT